MDTVVMTMNLIHIVTAVDVAVIGVINTVIILYAVADVVNVHVIIYYVLQEIVDVVVLSDIIQKVIAVVNAYQLTTIN